MLFSFGLDHSKALSWEVITYCLMALLGDFVRIPTCVLIQRPFMGKLLRCDNYVISVASLRTFALIVSAHPYCARKFACHVMHERARLAIK